MTRGPSFTSVKMRSDRQITPPSQTSQEVCELSAVAETVDGDGAALDLRHDPGDEDCYEERDGLGDEQKAWRSGLRRGIRGLGNRRMNFVSDDSDAKCDGREDDDEDEQAARRGDHPCR